MSELPSDNPETLATPGYEPAGPAGKPRNAWPVGDLFWLGMFTAYFHTLGFQ